MTSIIKSFNPNATFYDIMAELILQQMDFKMMGSLKKERSPP